MPIGASVAPVPNVVVDKAVLHRDLCVLLLHPVEDAPLGFHLHGVPVQVVHDHVAAGKGDVGLIPLALGMIQTPLQPNEDCLSALTWISVIWAMRSTRLRRHCT